MLLSAVVWPFFTEKITEEGVYANDGTFIPAERLSKAYFEKCHKCNLGEPKDDHNRCISCGTCRDCKMCLESCPEKAISRIDNGDGTWTYVSDPKKCIGCGICAGVCPCGIWTIKDNPEPIKMYRTYNKK